ncbi:hypothetical protein [Streptomyces carpinensis]|uniref:Lipoprotein n=1 Tax=Streptomyces carpinensis TaxID=66369 RepID=A0ABV1WDC7_9ACTN|nr:hypothetical protein [Streptomyces carpinensis]
MRRKILSIAAAGVTTVLMTLGACSNNTHPAQTTPTHTSPPVTTPKTPSGSMPTYPGATVTSNVSGTTMLHSGDTVSKVGAFYVDTLAREGWKTVSKHQGEFSTNIVAKRGREGVTVQVSPTGSGTSITISKYPVG